MNKYQKAIHYFKGLPLTITFAFNNYIESLQELVDKETPMEVNMEYYHLEDEYQHPIYSCPKCGKHINDEDNYCRHCGQRLDWSEE
jgi:predicted RNA-binding Zn-ribbon protein involved in translation (DUF1610 family)